MPILSCDMRGASRAADGGMLVLREAVAAGQEHGATSGDARGLVCGFEAWHAVSVLRTMPSQCAIAICQVHCSILAADCVHRQ